MPLKQASPLEASPLRRARFLGSDEDDTASAPNPLGLRVEGLGFRV